MLDSAFGVTHAEISKVSRKDKQALVTGGGTAAGVAAGVRVGRKLRPSLALATTVGGGAAGAIGGSKLSEKIKKSAFDVEHEVEKGMFSMPGAFRAAATSAAQKPMAAAGKLKPKPGGTMAGMAQNAKPFAQQNKKAIGGAAAVGGAGAVGGMSVKNKMSKPKPSSTRV